MGRSQTCNFQVNVNLSNGIQSVYGAMSLKDVKGIIASESEYQNSKGISVKNAEIWAQTKNGERYLKGFDYAQMDLNYSVTYYNILIN